MTLDIKVEEQLGSKKSQMSKVAFRRECRKYAERFIEVQRQGFRRLEVFGEWSNPYLTMCYEYEAEVEYEDQTKRNDWQSSRSEGRDSSFRRSGFSFAAASG